MRQPDWEYWLGQKKVRLWECLALSVDVEPRELGVDHFLVIRSAENGRPLLSSQDPQWLVEVCQRLETLFKALEDPPEGLRAGRGKAIVFDAELKLPGFADWAVQRKWSLPDTLRELAPASASAKAAAKSKPAPKSRAAAKSKAAPKAKATSKAKAASKSKAAPKAKAASATKAGSKGKSGKQAKAAPRRKSARAKTAAKK